MKPYGVSIQNNETSWAVESHRPIYLVSRFEFWVCYHSNESYWAVLSRGIVYYAVQGDSNFWV